ncbi:MAG: NTP transferase domain-containing protein, partial [Acidobacteriota bacterium]|nr:NTP transferase domain-containing protein [Acidobacteriota bacterium]
MTKRETVAVVLAGGRGTRMRSSTPKVLHEILGRPLLEWVFSAARASGCDRIVCVVGHEAGRVRESLASSDVDWVIQEQQRGTGHALAQTRSLLEKLGPASILVLSGDVPLMTAASLAALVEEAGHGWGAMAVANLEAPGAFGRVVEREDGALKRIVEAADATTEELDIRKVNAGTYVLPAPEIFAELDKLQPDNAQGELYLTDALTAAAKRGESIRLLELSDPSEALGVNQRVDLVRVKNAFIKRRVAELQQAGVTLWDPDRVWLEPGVEIGADTQVYAGVTLSGRTR